MPSREIVLGTIHQRWQIDVIASGSHLDLSLDGKGEKGRSALSLNKTLQNDVIDRRIMLERANIHVSEDDIEHHPLFAARFIKEMETRTD